jgi:D-tagatose-bisphosphate aldolase class II non-catalytic subunit
VTHPLRIIPDAFHAGRPRGITSVCSAHPVVIEAALRRALDTGDPVLIEATCNQVNQDGGYTGMTPAGFRGYVQDIAAGVGLSMDRVILGGDHLGPNPWKHLPATAAMAKAKAMIAAFAEAGFTKLHLDTSMGCAGEPEALADAATATRAAALAVVAEAHKGPVDPVYVIGTEVPVPGGALEDLGDLAVTTPEAVRQTHAVHRAAFADAGIDDAFARVIALVVQPGVEFGHSDVVHFAPEKAAALSASLHDLPGIVFEAHSTDYQTEAGLAALVGAGFAILKVGPWLTFALREALYGLDAVADVLDGHPPRGDLMLAMDAVMRSAPEHWSRYYHGDETELWLHRQFSYSDRIRYYWPRPEAQAAIARLHARLAGRSIPEPLLHQYLAGRADGGDAHRIMVGAVQDILRRYERACSGQTE